MYIVGAFKKMFSLCDSFESFEKKITFKIQNERPVRAAKLCLDDRHYQSIMLLINTINNPLSQILVAASRSSTKHVFTGFQIGSFFGVLYSAGMQLSQRSSACDPLYTVLTE